MMIVLYTKINKVADDNVKDALEWAHDNFKSFLKNSYFVYKHIYKNIISYVLILYKKENLLKYNVI